MDIAYELFKIRRSRFGDYRLCVALRWTAVAAGVFFMAFFGSFLGAG